MQKTNNNLSNPRGFEATLKAGNDMLHPDESRVLAHTPPNGEALPHRVIVQLGWLNRNRNVALRQPS